MTDQPNATPRDLGPAMSETGRRCGTCWWFAGEWSEEYGQSFSKNAPCIAPLPDSVMLVHGGVERFTMKYCEGGTCPVWTPATTDEGEDR